MISQQCFEENGVLGRSHFIYQDADAMMMLWKENPNIAFLICTFGVFLLTVTGTDMNRLSNQLRMNTSLRERPPGPGLDKTIEPIYAKS